MLSVDDALERMLALIEPVGGGEIVPLCDALGRVLAGSVHAGIDVPPFDNSAVDGYAYRIPESRIPQNRDLDNRIPESNESLRLPVRQRIPAGVMPEKLQTGEAARIFTGARIPDGANSVAMQEDCIAGQDDVQLPAGKPVGNNIRPKGQDIRLGAEVLAAGTCLRAAHLGLLASVGIPVVNVKRRLQVAIVSTGDELVSPGVALEGGQIYESNSYLLSGLLREYGCDVLTIGQVSDTPEATRAALLQASDADFILSTGGVSVGEEDHVKTVVAELGRLDLWRLLIKPGKPLAFGQVGNTPFMGLPGNPTAVFVTFMILAVPVLRKLQGRVPALPLVARVRAAFEMTKPGKRREFCRVRLATGPDGLPELQAYPNQSSAVLSSAAWATGFAVIRENTSVSRGDLVEYLSFSQLQE